MNLDFHVHGLLTKKCDFNEALFLQGIETAKEQGLDGYILCEHFNSNDILTIYEYLNNNYEYIGDKYIVSGLSIFVGMEVDVKNGGHVIVSGNRDNIMNVRKELEQHMESENFIEFEELLNLGEKYGCLMVGSHPYRDSHKLHLQPKELLKRLHALDLNATDIFKKGLECTKEEVENLSKEINVPFVTGSDSHYPIQLGSVKTKFNKEFITVKDIINSIDSRDYSIEVSKTLDLKVYSAKKTKKYIKEKYNV
ncbi:MAG: PHP-associated domain-containing protein [Peptostreptococcaceae bacterium]